MDARELFVLPAAEPIITFGKVAYTKYVMPEEDPVNEAQAEYMKMPPDPESPEPARAGAKKLTVREERRERRRREMQERQEAWQREREEAARAREEAAAQERVERANRVRVERAHRHNDSDSDEDDEPAQAVHVRNVVRPNVVVRDAAPNVVIPDAAAIEGPAVIAAADAVDPGASREKFWQIIARMNWHNASDGRIGAEAVGAVLRGQTAVDLLIFKREYANIYAGAVQVLEADGMFARNGADGHAARAKIVSHIIALGEDQYTTLVSDLAILQFLVESGECQSLNESLPEALRV